MHIQKILGSEDINFLLTNRIPRQALTHFMGWFSKIEHPWIRDGSIAVWKFFGDLDLSEARKSRFTSMHDCFTRELKEGARPIAADAGVMVSPVDAIVGAHGDIQGTGIFQAKGFPYTLEDLLGPDEDIGAWRDGYYVTLRLTSAMYHRFHAPHACTVTKVSYFSGDTWNVNPIALKRVEKLFCKNERAFLDVRLDGEGGVGKGDIDGQRVALVPVAAVLVASIRLHFLNTLFHLRYRGPGSVACQARFERGQEMGWFQHGSTVIVLTQKGFTLSAPLEQGAYVRMGQPLLRWGGHGA